MRGSWRGLTRRTSGDDDHISACEGFCEAVVDGFVAIDHLVVRCLVHGFAIEDRLTRPHLPRTYF